jgi:EAL domain-containing protein (putative c-di-GMP-specific phosphodiesterase class I)/ActR/RegA family two-component response regulator
LTEPEVAKERVLIIDDDPDVGHLLEIQIKATGRETRLTDEPEEFLALHRDWNPDFVVVDLVMPKMDGLDVLAHLSRDRCTARVVISSGMGGRVMDAARRFADANGLIIAGVLGKPHTQAELRAVFERHAKPRKLDSAEPAPAPTSWRATEFQVAFRTAVMGDEFAVAYQPKVDCKTGAVVGYEALARWNHPERGSIPPDEFVPLAERFGLVSLLTERVMGDALGWFAGRPHAEGVRIAINISAGEFDEPSLDKHFVTACEEAGVPPGDVVLEITETSAMADPARSLQLLTRLRLEGFHLSLDDFGTGYSSMLQLARLPFSELKVDRSFVTTAATSDESVIVVRSIIDLGHALGMHLTAEGVEDAWVLALLGDLGCDYAQGFYIARPMFPDALDAWAADVSI